MPQDMKEWRHKARQRLMTELGGKCWTCGSTDNLTFAHIVPLTEDQASWRCAIGSNARMVLYRKEHKEGLIKLLCQTCNNKEAKEPGQGMLAFNYESLTPF